MTDSDDFYDLRMALQRLVRAIRRNRSGGLTDAQLVVLLCLADHDHSPGDLAALESVSPPSMNRTLNGLGRLGLIARSRDDGDGRRVRVTLTERGAARARETRTLRAQWFSDRMNSLDPRERDLLRAVVPIFERLVRGEISEQAELSTSLSTGADRM